MYARQRSSPLQKLQKAKPSGPGAVRPTSLDFSKLDAESMHAQSRVLDAIAAGASCREEAANRLAQHFFDIFRDPATGGPACALVRCFQTVRLEDLPPARHAFATRRLGSLPVRNDTGIRCLALLATRGTEPGWSRVEDSAGHQAIPLPSVDVILRAPMIARLLLEIGIRFEHVVAPPAPNSGFILDTPPGTSNVFHVESALGSPYIPAQASFVHPFGIRSVLGMGGLLPSGELFATVLFSRVTIPRRVAELFGPLSLSANLALAPFPPERTFLAPRA